ncbi:hypothetical protein AB0F39_15300 [Streptomyces murinus]|uniref:hypothetical protein n=1 Tax=Streptomyces murinus TaxID=33900 RepID=UPI0033F9C751
MPTPSPRGIGDRDTDAVAPEASATVTARAAASLIRRPLGGDRPVRFVDPPTRGIYTLTPRRDPHPSTPALLDALTNAFATARPENRKPRR